MDARLSGMGEAAIDELKAKAPAFMARLKMMQDDFARTGNTDAGDLADYGATLKTIIENFTGAIDTAGRVMDSIMYGITHPFGYNIGLNGLGILPAVIAAELGITWTAGQIVALSSITVASAAAVAASAFITRADRVHADIMAGEFQIAQERAAVLTAQGDTAGAQAVIDKYNAVQVATMPVGIGSTLTTVAGAAVVLGMIYLFVKHKGAR